MASNSNFPDTHKSNSKAISQRQYREKEGEGFAELQQAICEVTGGQDEPEKRHDILMKAAQKIRELNRHNFELRRQLMTKSDSSGGSPGGQGPCGAAVTHNAPAFTVGAWGYDYNAGPSAQHYPGQRLSSNLTQAYPGQGRHV